jgi:hypothetical protein
MKGLRPKNRCKKGFDLGFDFDLSFFKPDVERKG